MSKVMITVKQPTYSLEGRSVVGKCPRKASKKLKNHLFVSSWNFLWWVFCYYIFEELLWNILFMESHGFSAKGNQSQHSESAHSLREAWPWRDSGESSDRGGVRPCGRIFASLSLHALHPQMQRTKKGCSQSGTAVHLESSAEGGVSIQTASEEPGPTRPGPD